MILASGFQRPTGIFNQSLRTQRPSNAFEDDDEDEDDDDLYDPDANNHTGIPRTTFSVERTTGMRNMTSTQLNLATIFQPPFDLIKNLDLEQAKDYAQTQKKWLLVNIQNSREFQCQVLNRDIWSNSSIKKVVSENFVFVQVSKASYAV